MTDDFEDFFENSIACHVCGSSKVVPPVGNKNSPILIVGDFPVDEDVTTGVPMTGPMGRVLRQELGHLGIDVKQLRRMNLWKHPVNKNPACFKMGVEEVLREAKDRKIILLLGGDPVKLFVGKSVMDLNGLMVESSLYFSCPVFCCISPGVVYKMGNGVGEIRFALTKFAKYVQENNL